MPTDRERMQVLQMIEDGQVSAAEGLRLLRALSGQPEAQAAASAPEVGAALPPEVSRWQKWWLLPLWLGLGVTVIGGWLMYRAYAAGGIGLGFAGAAVVFALGVLLAALAGASQSAKWIHIRILTGDQELSRIALSFPLPIRLTAWALRAFGRHIPKLRDTAADELILALAEQATPHNPVYLDVTDGEAGERVQVYFA